MRILIIANLDVGLFKFRKELITEILKKNEVYIALPYGALVDPFVKMGCGFVDTPMDRRGINPFTDLKLIRNYFSIVNKVKPDMVITYTIKPNIYAGWICKIKGIRYAVNITGLGTAFEKGGFLKKLVIFMYKRALGKAGVVFFENQANKELFVKEGIIAEKMTYVLHGAGVNLDEFSPIPYPRNMTCRFLFIGRVMKEKGMDELFAAMKRLVENGEKCSLDVVGPFEDDYKAALQKYEAEGWLKYHGYQEDVRPFIAECDCFVLPSYHEGMANTNLECAASGRPIITSNIPGCREAVIDGISGYLCESQNADSLYKAMKKMIRNKDSATMGLEGRKHMEEAFDRRIVVQETINQLFHTT